MRKSRPPTIPMRIVSKSAGEMLRRYGDTSSAWRGAT